ncbi:MAG TPA: hypothetical protein VIV58_19655 [Kofleriaceae bacterium]
MFDEQFDSLKSSVKKLIDRTTTKPTWFGRAINTTSDMIVAHPIAAIGVALGIGYAIVRIVRR